MNKVVCKGLILKYNGETKCIVPNKPVVIVMPTVGSSLFSDGAYAGDALQTVECEPDTRWFRTKEVDGELEMVTFSGKGIEQYIREMTGIKDDAEKKLKKIKKIVEE